MIVALFEKGPTRGFKGPMFCNVHIFYEWSKSQESGDIMSWSITIFYLNFFFFGVWEFVLYVVGMA